MSKLGGDVTGVKTIWKDEEQHSDGAPAKWELDWRNHDEIDQLLGWPTRLLRSTVTARPGTESWSHSAG